MKKFNIIPEKRAIIVFTTIQILCVFNAAVFALQEQTTNVYTNAISALFYLFLTYLIEWVKYKITHNDDTLNTLD